MSQKTNVVNGFFGSHGSRPMISAQPGSARSVRAQSQPAPGRPTGRFRIRTLNLFFIRSAPDSNVERRTAAHDSHNLTPYATTEARRASAKEPAHANQTSASRKNQDTNSVTCSVSILYNVLLYNVFVVGIERGAPSARGADESGGSVNFGALFPTCSQTAEPRSSGGDSVWPAITIQSCGEPAFSRCNQPVWVSENGSASWETARIEILRELEQRRARRATS